MFQKGEKNKNDLRLPINPRPPAWPSHMLLSAGYRHYPDNKSNDKEPMKGLENYLNSLSTLEYVKLMFGACIVAAFIGATIGFAFLFIKQNFFDQDDDYNPWT